MVVIDSIHDVPVREPSDSGHTGQMVLLALLGSVVLAIVTQAFYAGEGSGDGWSVAAQMVSRFSLLLFVAAMSVEPLARLFPIRAMQALGRERASLTLAFASAMAVSLLCVVAPSQFAGQSMSAPAIAYCALTAMILVVMLFSSLPAAVRRFGAPVARALQRISTSYFWLAFVLIGLDHIVGPHRPESWHGFSLLLLTATLLLRFTDSFVGHWRGMAEKVA